MPHDSRRPDRVAEGIREVVATFLTEDVKDPRISGLVTVTGVDVPRDLRQAKIFVSVMGSPEERAKTFEGLKSVALHLRGKLGRALRLRHAPELVFLPDDSIARAARIEELLAGVRDSTPPDPGAESAAADGDAGGDSPAPANRDSSAAADVAGGAVDPTDVADVADDASVAARGDDVDDDHAEVPASEASRTPPAPDGDRAT